MTGAGGELAEVQQELQAVKKALRDGTGYLGMSGEPLQKYLLQLNEKENLVLSQQLKTMKVSAGSNNMAAVAAAGGGAQQGAAQAFNKDDVSATLQHLRQNEGSPQECTKALRALAPLAYNDPAGVGGNDQVLEALLRVVATHACDANVQAAAMRLICNMAADPAVVAEKLANSRVLGVLLATVVGSSDPKSAASKQAREALARMVSPEVIREGSSGASALPQGSKSPLATLFLTASMGDVEWQITVPKLIAEMKSSEDFDWSPIVDRFMSVYNPNGIPEAAVGWLSLAKQLVGKDSFPEVQDKLVEVGAIRAATQLMKQFPSESAVQVTAIEGMSALIGTNMQALKAFVDAGGVQRIEDAMAAHPGQEVLQIKSIRAMASGILWPEDVQRKAGYDARRAVALTKAAMVCHGPSEELQWVALEALTKYLESCPFCKDEVAAGGSEGLVKATMTRHLKCDKVQDFGRKVLTGLGVERTWRPAARGLNGAS